MRINLHLLILIVSIALLSACSGTAKLKNGDQAFEQKSYAIAATLFKTEFKEEEIPTLRAEIAFKIGESYRYNNDTDEAEKWYAEAARLGYEPIALFNHGLMLKANEKYELAAAKFGEYAREEPLKRQEAIDQVKACQQAIRWKQERSNVQILNLENINTNASEYAPVFFKNDKLVYSSDRLDASGEDLYGWTGERYSDLFVSRKEGADMFVGIANFSGVLNSGINEGTATFNKDFNEVYFTRCGSQGKEDDYCGIWRSEMWAAGEWSTPEYIYLFPDTVNVGHPFLSKDGKKLLFSAEAEEGYGGKDLYISYFTSGEWGEPQNLGSTINTDRNEMYPYIDSEGHLYFASDGHMGLGGLDIFKAKPEGDKWLEVENMKPPINSGADDFSVIFDKTKPKNANDPVRMSGYFASNRKGGKGKDDLYRFVLSNDNIFKLDGIVLEKIFEDPKDPNSKLVDLEVIENAQITLKKYGNGLELVGELNTNENGKFSYDLSPNTNYTLVANKTGYFSKSIDKISTKGLRDLNNVLITIKVRVILDKVYEEVPIIIPNIYYDYDSTSLREESFVVLDTLGQMLEDNPEIMIEIGSHTDSRGSADYNQKLSEGRAESVVRYLVGYGIDVDRMTAKGYGESEILNKCVDGVECTEEEHQKNRRTTFKVLAESFIIESVTPDSIKVDKAPPNR